MSPDQYARLAPVVLRPGEKIAFIHKESWVWVRWEDGTEAPRSNVDGKMLIGTIGWEADDNG